MLSLCLPPFQCLTLYLNRAARKFLIDTLTLHAQETGSSRAAYALANIDAAISRCWVVVPNSEKGNPILAKEEAAVSSSASAAV